ncbi:MAG: Fe-S assembly protein IscX [SAR92 clade bacterium]|uniref:Fe-S assembly protein IscX n=1 Tax=SAR92 clade bacterium TaxID=2315479 RepID=A0A520LP55_9GAMM|nr:MAG: Fe-S assembly protein IscX [SAR92 clade bacterium]
MKWTDVSEIAIELSEEYPDENPIQINFVTLRDRVMDLSNFSDDANRCGEKILEAIQMAWIEELD